ncbi:MAG TPA: SRPBCC family protein [Gemmatimonadota bacterium]|nr:SRPBCC family protein [Gemmatimonadota bacterium]
MGWIRKGVAIGGVASAATLAWRARRRGNTATRIEAAITVQQPRAEVWSFWRRPEELPRILPGLEAVRPVADGRYRWWTSGPVETDGSLEILEEQPEELLSYRVREGSGVEGQAQVRLSDAPGGATVVRVALAFDPPEIVARALGAIDPAPRRALKEVLRRHRQLLEAGEIPTTDGQPAGAGRSQSR